MSSYLLGIDIGTTSTKVIVCDLNGEILADFSRGVALNSRQPGWAEENPDHWWVNVCELIPQCLKAADAAPSEILAVGVSGMVPAIVLLDSLGKVVRPSIQQNDARSHQEIEWFKKQVSKDYVLETTGSPVTQQSVGPKLRWLWAHEPKSMAKVRNVVGSYDFVVYRLTGELSLERNWALESGLWNLYEENWDHRLMEMAQLDCRLLPSVHHPTEISGQVNKEASLATGLSEGTPVIVGSADHVASAFSAGIRDQGALLVKLGGAGDILYCLDHIEVDPCLFLDYHVIPGKYLLNGCMAASGSIIKWFRDELAMDATYETLDSNAKDLPAGSDGLILLPYFLGEKSPISDPLARGVFFGLTLSHTRAHMYKAILEGISYGFKHHVEVLAKRGMKPTLARVTNGGAHSLLWRQITADVLGLPLEHISQHPGSSLGAAVLAGIGVGAFGDWREIDRYIHIAGLTEPNMEAHSRYQNCYQLYKEIYDSLKDKFPQLVGLGGGAS